MALKLFVDFDGTVTRHDVGNAFFREFGGPVCDGIVAKYLAGEISAHECFRREAAAIGSLDVVAAERFVRSQPIDPSFAEFASFCEERSLEFSIVSDGLDFYIDAILATNGLSGIPSFSNRLELIRDAEQGKARLALTFPYSDAECDRCACCKRNIILSRAGESDIIGYIGEGYSDRCPVRYADIVFAKDELQTYCQQENISYYVYGSFHDIVERLRELLQRKKLRKRRRAELNRREAFLCE